jgi:RHS repeat-associated protein
MYHADGQLARANYGGKSEDFLWDGLALVRRNDEHFINEPHVGGGNPVASSKGTSYFNDALGTTVGFKSNGKYSAAALTAFGEDLTVHSPTPTQNSNFFTGKPFVEGLGHAFLMRNYRAGIAKWQTADPMGYPDGWNQLAYCNNGVTGAVDLWGCAIAYHEYEIVSSYRTEEFHRGEVCSLPDQRERKKSISGDIIDFLTGKGYGRIDTKTVDVGDIWSLCEGEPRINEWDQDGYHYVSECCYQRKTLQKDKLWIWTAEIQSLRAEVDSWVGDAATIGGAVALMAKMLGYATVAGVSVSSLGTATTVTGLLALLDRMLTYSPVTQVELYRQTTFYETDDWRIGVTIFRKRIAE